MLSQDEQKLLESIDETELIRFLQKLVQTNSENPPGNEEACALLIEEELRSFGCRTELQYVEPGRPNVIGTMEGEQSEKVLLNGHLDTVKIGKPENWSHEPLGGEVVDGRLYGRGSCDMKAGLVAMLFAMKAVAKSNVPLKRGVLFTGVIDEEVYFKGTNALVEAELVKDCSLGFVSEPTSLAIVTEHKGAIEYGCEVTGKSAHSGKAHQGINAIVRMAKVIEKLEQYNKELLNYQPAHPLFQTPTVNVGTIAGGSGITFVPEQCRIEFDRQILPGESIGEVAKEVDEVFSVMEKSNGYGVTLSTYQSFAPWQVAREAEHVTDFEKIVSGTLGRPAQFSGLYGYCEAEILGRAGIPCLVFGPGSIDRAHAPDEYVPVQEVIEAAKVYAIAIYRYVTAS